MNPKYEEEIIRLFVHRDRKERYLYKLARPDRRREVLAELWAMEFDPRCIIALPHNMELESLGALLNAKGAGKQAYMFTLIEELDGQTLPLLDALTACVGFGIGTIVYCFEGRIAYYESDDVDCCLLHKTN